MRLPRSRFFYAGLALLALFVVALANVHLVMVAGSSQPACVAHVRPGETAIAPSGFSAARSSC
ncbi:MAG: hypothetical protein AB7G25_01255 [Sphingomonadaceae bacterium]